MSFFNSITSEFTKKEQERREAAGTPTISVTPPGLSSFSSSAVSSPVVSAVQSSSHSPSGSVAIAGPPLTLTLSHAAPSSTTSPLFYHNSVIVASLSVPPASLSSSSVIYEWSRQQPLGDSQVVQSSDSPTYQVTLDDVDATITCTYRSSTSPHDTATASSYQPITLSSAFIASALSPFSANSAVHTVREWPSHEECTLTVRRTSLRIVSAATQQLKSSFRISSTAASTTLSCQLVEGGVTGRFVLSDSVTERRWEGECRDGRDECECVVLLVRRLIEKPDFEWEEEVRRAEQEERRREVEARQRMAADEKQRQEREQAQEKERERLQKERAEQEAKRQEEQQSMKENQPSEAVSAATPSPTAAVSSAATVVTPSVTETNTTSAAVVPAATSAPPSSNSPLPSTSTIDPSLATTPASSTLLEVHLLPAGQYHSLLAMQTNHAALAAAHSQLQSQLTQAQQQYTQDQASFAHQLQQLMADKQATHLTYERERKQLRDLLQQRDEEVREARGDVDAVRKQLSAIGEEMGRQSGEVGRLREEVKGWKVREVEWVREREVLSQRMKQREDELKRDHTAATDAASTEVKRREEKLQGKLSTMEENLRKAAKELGKMKEKEARVDALEMENHKLIREIEYMREYAEGSGNGKAGGGSGGSGGGGGSGAEQDGDGEGLGNEEWARERERLESELRERDIRVEQLQALLDGRVREIDELHEIATQMADKEMRLEEEVARLTADVERIDSECQTLRVQREEMKGEREEREAELKRWKDKVDELEGSVNYHKKKIVTLTQQIEKGIKEKAAIKQQMKEELHGLTELQEEIKELRREKESVMSEMVKYRTAYNNLTLGVGGAGGDGVVEGGDVGEAGRTGSELSQLRSVRELVSQLTEQLSDKDEALSHMRKTNQILGVRVKELEERFKHELVKAPPVSIKR